MNAKKMLKLCRVAQDKLATIERLLSHIPPEKNADAFVYASVAAVKELRGIAKWETTCNVTVEQASHINSILSKADYLLKLIPRDVKRGLDGNND